MAILGIIIADEATDGAVLDAVSDFINNITSTVERKRDTSKIDNKKAAKGNKKPAGNKTDNPMGTEANRKNSNAGAEKIPDPSKLGDKGFKPPNRSVAAFLGVGLGGTASILNDMKETMDPARNTVELVDKIEEETTVPAKGAISSISNTEVKEEKNYD